MKRRDATLVLVSVAALTRVLAQSRPPARIGLLGTFGPSVPNFMPVWNAFFAELSARGWAEGRNLVVEGRYNETRTGRDAALAAELLATRPEVVVATSSGAVDALRKATRTVPIVMVNVSHAVEPGFVASMSRPGGNVTGVTNQAGDMQGKFIDLLRSVRPDLQRLAVMWSPDNQGSSLAYRDAQAAASAVGVQVLSLPLDQPTGVDRALARASTEGVQALQVHPTPGIGAAWRDAASWALEHKVATLGQAAWVREGFLLSYWAHVPDLFRIAAGFVDRILRGARPAEMPVEQPTRFELTVNLRTARAIGAKIPNALLLSADAVIE